MRVSSPWHGFTLIELLVVVAIIVILIAMLAPSIDRAIYQTELTVCGTRQRAIVNSVITYALENHRRYPHREGISRFGSQPYQIADGRNLWDDRPLFKKFMPLNLMNDPLTGDLKLDPSETNPKSYVFSSYDLWFGFQYKTGTESGMFKMGDRFSWQGDQFSYLVTDRDNVSYGDSFAHESHPDRENILVNHVRQDAYKPGDTLDETFGDPYTKARWESSGVSPARGTIDNNYAGSDGAVIRLTELKIRDTERLIPVPEYANGSNYTSWATYLPKP